MIYHEIRPMLHIVPLPPGMKSCPHKAVDLLRSNGVLMRLHKQALQPFDKFNKILRLVVRARWASGQVRYDQIRIGSGQVAQQVTSGQVAHQVAHHLTNTVRRALGIRSGRTSSHKHSQARVRYQVRSGRGKSDQVKSHIISQTQSGAR
jgi:hypothetical protein